MEEDKRLHVLKGLVKNKIGDVEYEIEYVEGRCSFYPTTITKADGTIVVILPFFYQFSPRRIWWSVTVFALERAVGLRPPFPKDVNSWVWGKRFRDLWVPIWNYEHHIPTVSHPCPLDLFTILHEAVFAHHQKCSRRWHKRNGSIWEGNYSEDITSVPISTSDPVTGRIFFNPALFEV